MNIRNKLGTIDWRYIIIEVSIIVIGILIALQVDNWKDDRNTRLKELKILRELNSELVGDLKTLDETQKRCEDVISALGTLQMHLYKKLAYHDSLNNQAFKIVYQIRYEYRKSAFENLKSIGSELISNDSIKKMLIELYEYSYPRHLKIIDIEANSEKYRDFYDNNRIYVYRQVKDNKGLEIDELLDLKVFDDPKFLDLVTSKMASFIIVNRHIKALQDELSLLTREISKEIADR